MLHHHLARGFKLRLRIQGAPEFGRQVLGARREVAPDRFAIIELFLSRPRSVQRSLALSQIHLGLAGLLEAPLALLPSLFEMLRDLDAG